MGSGTPKQAEAAISKAEIALEAPTKYEEIGMYSSRALELNNQILGPLKAEARYSAKDNRATYAVNYEKLRSATQVLYGKLVSEGILKKRG